MKETPPSRKARALMRKILTEDEVRLISRRLQEALGPTLTQLSGHYGLSIADSIRFQAVASRLLEAREARGMDLKTAAKALRVPQYRLQEIERCRVNDVQAYVLAAYVDFLGLRRWFARWRKANPKLAAKLRADSIEEEDEQI